jgi:hypothetical protein
VAGFGVSGVESAGSYIVCSGSLIWGDHDRWNWKVLEGSDHEIFEGTTRIVGVLAEIRT